MRLRGRLERLEVKGQDTRPAVLCLTAEGLKDLHGEPVKSDELQGVKVIVGIDPREL